MRKKPSSGLFGVRERSKGKYRYWARISIHGKQKTIGFFSTPEEAQTAYLLAILERHSLYKGDSFEYS